ncbi:ABC transporter ATP-binding protein [Alicyclobacillus cellulosilyticus]|uniref:ABC transporter ATP-binding protein n=1 Tax=Alicyclobacillus cellulosilyticus TaxID=1003997 RepID=A0A917K6V2_9BACL|nr:ABC transporter ATP-binding protein [Alicyclobacillus cellulosilyticus]GGJ02937.1 ABC transporter ATP-binding protein [Alicyclobacillus cellulosilyticus]
MAMTRPRQATELARMENLVKVFRTPKGSLVACDHISLRLEQGTSLGLVGESGSGKTTLVRILLMLERPTSGRVWLNGVEVTRLSERRLKPHRRLIQFVAQDPYSSLFPNLTVGQNIMEPLRVHKVGRAQERMQRAMELMERVGLSTYHFYAYPHELSGGQQQRVAIARALALSPQAVVLDEAVSSLDVSVQAQILNLLQQLKDEMGLTYLFISHNLAVIRLLCEMTAVMYMGRIVEYGKTDDVLHSPSHPYTRSLIASIPSFTDRGVTPLPDLSSLAGERPSPLRLPPGCAYQTRCPLVSERCRAERPELREVASGQCVACHHA